MSTLAGQMKAVLDVDQSAFDAGLATAGKKFDVFGKQLSEKQLGMVKGAGMAVTALGAAGAVGLGSAVKTSMDFGKEMSKVGALAGASKGELEDMRKEALKLGADTKYSASEAAAGMEELASGGMNANQIMAAMPGVLDAAAASGADVAQIAELTASTLNQFGMEASKSGHIADVLTVAANRSALTVTDFQYSMKYAGPAAAALGYSLEDTTAAIMAMGNAGIKGEQGGTTLRAALLSLVNPGDKAATMMDRLGLQITDKEGKMKRLPDIIDELNRSTADMTEADRAAAVATIFGREAASGMLAMMKAGKPQLEEYSQALTDSAGAAKKTADEMQDNLAGALEQLGGSVDSAKISLGDALTPAIRQAAETLTWMVNAFNDLPEPAKKAIAYGLTLTTVLALIGGPALMIIGYLPRIIEGFQLLGTVFGGLSKTPSLFGLMSKGIGLLLTPTGLFIAALLLVGAGIIYVIKHWDKFGPKVKATWDNVTTASHNAMVYLKDGMARLADAYINYWSKIRGKILEAIAAALEFVGATDKASKVRLEAYESEYRSLGESENRAVGQAGRSSKDKAWMNSLTQGYAAGTDSVAMSGAYWVGETGKELVWLNRGDKVMSNKAVQGLGNAKVDVSGKVLHEFKDTHGNQMAEYVEEIRQGNRRLPQGVAILPFGY